MLKDAGGGRSEAELLAAFGCGVELFFFFFFSGSLFSLDSLFLSLLKLERASLASSSLSLYNHAEPRSPEATAAAADGRLASQRYGISIADEAFFGGSLSLSLVTLSQPSLPLEQTAFGVAHVVDASGALVPAYVVHGEGNA